MKHYAKMGTDGVAWTGALPKVRLLIFDLSKLIFGLWSLEVDLHSLVIFNQQNLPKKDVALYSIWHILSYVSRIP